MASFLSALRIACIAPLPVLVNTWGRDTGWSLLFHVLLLYSLVGGTSGETTLNRSGITQMLLCECFIFLRGYGA